MPIVAPTRAVCARGARSRAAARGRRGPVWRVRLRLDPGVERPDPDGPVGGTDRASTTSGRAGGGSTTDGPARPPQRVSPSLCSTGRTRIATKSDAAEDVRDRERRDDDDDRDHVVDDGPIAAADDRVDRRDPAGLERRAGREQRRPGDERDARDGPAGPATKSAAGHGVQARPRCPTAGRPRGGRGPRSSAAAAVRRRQEHLRPVDQHVEDGRDGDEDPARPAVREPDRDQADRDDRAVGEPARAAPREPWPDFARTIEPVWKRKSALRWARTSQARTRIGSVIGRAPSPRRRSSCPATDRARSASARRAASSPI